MINRMSTMQKEEKDKNQEFVKKITLKAKQIKELNSQVKDLKQATAIKEKGNEDGDNYSEDFADEDKIDLLTKKNVALTELITHMRTVL